MLGTPPKFRNAFSCRARKALELLIPDRFLVAVTRVAQRHPEHPGTAPLARLAIEGRRALEVSPPALLPRQAVHHAAGALLRSKRPYVALHRLVAVAVREALHQVLEDALDRQPELELLRDRVVVRGCREAAALPEPGNVLAGFDPGPANVLAGCEPSTPSKASKTGPSETCRAGERFGRIWIRLPGVTRDRLPAHPRLTFDPSEAPLQGEQRENLLSLRHLQVVGQGRPSMVETIELPRKALPEVAGFQAFLAGRIWAFANRLAHQPPPARPSSPSSSAPPIATECAFRPPAPYIRSAQHRS